MSQPAQETTVLIDGCITATADGRAKIHQVAAVVQSLSVESAAIRTLAEEARDGSAEQTLGVEQISQALTQMDEVTQTNAATAEQCASAVDKLNVQAQKLRDVVEKVALLAGYDVNAPVAR